MLSAYTDAPERTPVPTRAVGPNRSRAQRFVARQSATDEAVQVQVEAGEAIASVTRAVRAQAGSNVLQVVHGAKRVGWAAYELQRTATDRVLGVVKPPYSFTDSGDSIESAKLAEGIQYKVLYDRSALALPPQLEVTSKLVGLGEQARVIHIAPTKMLIIDNEVALLPLTTTDHAVESAVVIRNSAMLTAMMRIFEDLWRFAAPFTADPTSVIGDSQPSEEERWILSLLASGATDDTIGRLMGFSARTAHRRVRELVARLGVETRFQAGMQAVKLGWL